MALDFVEHFGKAEQIPLFEAINAALRSGGRLILETPTGRAVCSQVIYGDLTHLTIFSEGSLSQLLKLTGFERMEFYETGPAPKDLKGRVRGILWRIIKLIANKYARIIESGVEYNGYGQRLDLLRSKTAVELTRKARRSQSEA